MKRRLNAYILFIFFMALGVALLSGPIEIDITLYAQLLIIYLLFTTLYSHLQTIVKTGRVNIDYSISYGLSFGLVAGPFGLFLFELINRFYVFLYREKTDTADKDEFLHTFYNVGAPTLLHSLGFYLYYWLLPYFEAIPLFGFWILIILIVFLIDTLSSILLLGVFHIVGDIKTWQDRINFIQARSKSESLQKAISNGLLFIFIMEGRWGLMFALFVLNYIFSRSAVLKSQSIQHKIERDRFEQMAYTDFLTKVHNRTYMNKVMRELNQSGEQLGIVVCDIDDFKRINDTYNHTVGDHVIHHFATRLKSFLSKEDYLFRSGGEEFTIILRKRNYNACKALVDNIQEEIQKLKVKSEYRSKEISVSCTASFGMYYFIAEGDTDIKQGYIHADDLLNKAKSFGKNQVISKNGMFNKPLSVKFANKESYN
ncbi:GGDEF domain-containing protein [Oceanobacillus luteolus]|uniref:GGDEF domain-containing protein n=1 Tax=Oceanobacillus luteolus TaxID=1274358 RepID=A0ABW4HL09_9BACI